MGLYEELKKRPPAPAVERRSDPPFTHQLQVSGDQAEVTLRDKPENVTEGRAREFLEEEGLDPDSYMVSGVKKSMWGREGQEQSSVAFTFKKVGTGGLLALPDLDDLHATIERTTSKRKSGPLKPDSTHRTLIAAIADAQVGKVDTLGGTKELLVRLEASRAKFIEQLEAERPAEVILYDSGDCIENFENTAAQDRTNDLQLTEQIRVWRRVFWRWIDTAAEYAPSVKVVAVPSNHGRVRRGKGALGPPHDDYGIEVLAQLSDMAQVYPERYGHVEFYSPTDHSETMALKAAGGKVLGFAHGHQVTQPDKLPTWLSGQALGRTPIGHADIVVFGHFHHLRVQTVGDDRWLFIAPTSDNGSSWFTNLSGNNSKPGVMTFIVEEDGWRGLRIC